MNSISHEDINKLKSNQLTHLLLLLLHLEYKKYNFPDCYISVPQNITTADGGEDGRVQTSDFKESRWVKNNYCLFQCKATSMSISDCGKEILKSGASELKVQVNEVLNNQGTYILFITDAYVEQVRNENRSQRVKGIRDTIERIKGEAIAKEAKIEIYDANLIRDWVNEFISAISYVQLCNQIPRPNGLLIWSQWKSYRGNSNEFKFNDKIEELVERIRENLINGQNIRVEGVSGIGKSRLMCEILSPGKLNKEGDYNIERKSLSDSAVYFDVGSGNSQNILDFVRNTVTDLPAILVLDNCDPEQHKLFLNEVQRTNSKQIMISIDFERLESGLNDCEIYNLRSEDYKSVVEEILREKYKDNLRESDLKYMIEFSEGNPSMAIRFVEAAINNENLGGSFDYDLVKKLVFGRGMEEKKEFEILKLFSAFKYFEYPDDNYYNIDKSHYNLLLEHTSFLAEFFDYETNDLRNVIIKYLKKGVLERRGHKLIIRPNPLSLKLCLLFWNGLDPIKSESFISKLPKTLHTPLVEQLHQLGGVDKAKDLVQNIWGFNGNFSTAEILNSRMGSQLFCSIVTVNPEATIQVLENHYLNKPKEELEKVKEGRQYLVWSLERLCFRKETFERGAKVLMCFAAAENEFRFSNNSTHYFIQLFRIILAGTEVGYSPRLNILNWALSKNSLEFNEIVLKACEQALSSTRSAHKMLGAEKQGGLKTLVDYYPKSFDEINEYREAIINILINFMTSDGLLSKASQKVIYSNIRSLFESQYSLVKLDKVMNVIIKFNEDNKELINKLYNLRYVKGLTENQRNFIKETISKLRTGSLSEQIFYNVSEPKSFNIFEIKNWDGKELTHKFAKHIVDKRINIKPYFEQLLTGTQVNGFIFGSDIGSLLGYQKSFFSALLNKALELENNKDFNLVFLFGYLSVMTNTYKDEAFNFYVGKKSSFAFNLFRYATKDYNNLEKLIKLIEGRDVNPEKLLIIKHEVVEYCPNELLEYFMKVESLSEGIFIVYDTIHLLFYKNRNQPNEIDDRLIHYFKTLIERNNLLQLLAKKHSNEFYNWEENIKILISRLGNSITKIISSQIVEYFKMMFPNVTGNHSIAGIANETLNIDFDNCWEIYAELLQDGNMFVFWEIFDMSFISGVGPNHPFFSNEVRNTKLFEWLTNNPIYADWIIRVVPLYGNQSEKWFPLSLNLIKVFGDNDHFLTELSCNLHSMFTSGSKVPYLESRKRLLEQLLEIDNPNVIKWAKKEISYFDKEIQIERINDEERLV